MPAILVLVVQGSLGLRMFQNSIGGGGEPEPSSSLFVKASCPAAEFGWPCASVPLMPAFLTILHNACLAGAYMRMLVLFSIYSDGIDSIGCFVGIF